MKSEGQYYYQTQSSAFPVKKVRTIKEIFEHQKARSIMTHFLPLLLISTVNSAHHLLIIFSCKSLYSCQACINGQRYSNRLGSPPTPSSPTPLSSASPPYRQRCRYTPTSPANQPGQQKRPTLEQRCNAAALHASANT